jgi:predicted peptidase
MDTFDLDRRALLGLPLALAMGGAAAGAPTPPAAGRQTEWATPASLAMSATLRHWLVLPAGYHEQPRRAWPLVVFLHGSGERGRDLAKVKVHGLPKLIDAGARVPAIVVSPQCEENDEWDPHLLHALLLALRREWRIDPARVTATGMSMGGGGCWNWAMTWPDDLAGIAPVCGYGGHLRLARMRAVPVRAYHGADDTVVPLSAQRQLVDEFRALGGLAELTIYPGVGHDAWNPAYGDPGLLPWLLARARP